MNRLLEVTVYTLARPRLWDVERQILSRGYFLSVTHPGADATPIDGKSQVRIRLWFVSEEADTGLTQTEKVY